MTPAPPRPRSWLPLVALLFVSQAACIPFMLSHWFKTHDMVAYPIRVVEYVDAWRAGHVLPRWAADTYGGFGSPLFVFYAPALTIVAGLLHVLGAAPALALKLTLLALTMLGAAGSFLWARAETERDDAAFVAGVCFAFNPYRLCCLLYTRGDLSEYAAYSLVPWVFYFYRQLLRVPESQAARTMVAAALAQAAVILTHTITGQWTTELAALVMLPSAWRWWRGGERYRLRLWIIAVALGCLLTAVYTVPALSERPLVHINWMIEGPGRHVTDNMVTPIWFFGPGFFFIGWGATLAVVGCLGAALLWRKRLAPMPLLAWALLTALLLCMQMTPAAPVWSLLPLSRYIMFPWRLLGFVAVLGGLCAALAFAALVRLRGRLLPWLLASLVALLMVYDAARGPTKLDPLNDSDVPMTPAAVADRIESTVVFNEYLPHEHADPPREPARAVTVNPVGCHVERASRRSGRFDVTVDADRPGATLQLQSYCYPGWRIPVQTGPVPATLGCERGFLQLQLPQTGRYRVVAYFGTTPLRAASGVVSLTALALLGFAWWRMRRPAVGETHGR